LRNAQKLNQFLFCHDFRIVHYEFLSMSVDLVGFAPDLEGVAGTALLL
jgi:hypothetical protein